MEVLKPNIAVLRADGINCDDEIRHAFDTAGGNAKFVHLNELRRGEEVLKNYQILAIPGGFSYGDDVISGKILGLELDNYLGDQVNEFIQKDKRLVLGVCNGFQVLVRSGMLPFGTMGERQQATLITNASGKFECRWVNLKVEENNACVFLGEGIDPLVTYQIAHGEGKFVTNPKTLQSIEDSRQVVFRYADRDGHPSDDPRHNPNGSLHAIAGITDPSGRILGLMPHPERFVRDTQHPMYHKNKILGQKSAPQGLPVFERMIKYAREM